MPTALEMPIHRSLGLTDGELQRIVELMGREPNHFELAVFSLLWSEHCGYKHSRPELRRLPTDGPRVLQGPGENAGVIDVGDGLALAFKVESHNHPSAVEPYQGAATGVGGILRDVFAMGARPIAILDSLRLGPLDEARPRRLFDGIVRGVGGYGNCVGVANVGRRDGLRCGLPRQPARQRDVPRRARGRAARARDGGGRRERGRALRRRDRARRHRRCERARLPGPRRGERRQAPVGPDRRSVHREEAARVLARARTSAASSSRCRISAPPASRRRWPRWPRVAVWVSRSSSRTFRCARPGCTRSRS